MTSQMGRTDMLHCKMCKRDVLPSACGRVYVIWWLQSGPTWSVCPNTAVVVAWRTMCAVVTHRTHTHTQSPWSIVVQWRKTCTPGDEPINAFRIYVYVCVCVCVHMAMMMFARAHARIPFARRTSAWVALRTRKYVSVGERVSRFCHVHIHVRATFVHPYIHIYIYIYDCRIVLCNGVYVALSDYYINNY